MRTLESRRLRSVMRARTITRRCPAGRLRGGASAAGRLACAGAAWPSGLDPPTQGGEKCERWSCWSCQHLDYGAAPLAPAAVELPALPHAHGHARVQRAQPCSAARGHQPRETAGGGGPSRCAIAPLRHWYHTIKLSDNLSLRCCRRPRHGVARGCAGLGAAVPAAPRSITIGHLRTAHNWAL